MQHRVVLTIDLKQLGENYQAVCGIVSPCEVMPVLKANAYGLGVAPIAQALVAAGARRIAVAEPFEALQLLHLNVPVQILSGILPDEMDEMIAHGIVLPIVSFESAQQISAIACAQQTTATVHIKLDTGMGRAGIHWTEAVHVLAQIATLPGLQVEGIFTHFPLAYEQGSDFTDIQVKRFSDILEAAQGLGYHFKYIHAANSDAINNAQITCQTPFNLVRCGINLHGAFDAAGSLRVPLQPVLKMTTRLAQVRTLPADTPIGYGHTFRTQAPMRVGTVCAGYADGLPLALSNKGTVIIRGVEVPIIGRISMDYLTVCLDRVPDAQTGDCVTLLGRDGEAEIQVDTWAKLKQTHAYDIICSIGSRVERRCV